MAQILLGLGSNIEPKTRLESALRALRQSFASVRESPWFESHALRGGANYLNLVVSAQTQLGIDEVNALLHSIEAQNGRERGNEASGCALDIDLLCFDQRLIDTPSIRLPRADLLEHAHVLWPVAELCPELKHPTAGMTYAELWQVRKDELLKNQTLWPI